MTGGLVLLRRLASNRSALPSVTCSIESLLLRNNKTSPRFSTTGPELVVSRNGKSLSIGWFSGGGFGGVSGRGFHGGAALGFRASLSSQAEYAVADLYDEDKSRGDVDEGLEISKLGISEQIVSSFVQEGHHQALSYSGNHDFNLRKRAVLEPAMRGRDMIGRARTGTGKTLAFGIPIMDKIIKFNEKHGCGRNPLALILAPTRELARQVDKEFYESAPKLESLCVYGGVPISRQMSQLDHGVDVVVGTPGRIIDLIKRGALNLSEIQFLVIDEADQMLNVGFAEDVETILDHLPKKRQSMMFSATMPNWIIKLAQKYLKDPLTIDLVGNSVQKLADGISLYSILHQRYIEPGTCKRGKCIVFTQTKRDADRLAYAMQRSFKCEALHGDISQNQRERTLSGFRDGRFNILVATDVAARGLDVPNVDLLPRIPVEGGTSNMFSDMSSSRFGSTGGARFGGSGFGRSAGYGGSGTGRSTGYGSNSSGRMGGGSGSGRSSGGFGGFNSSRSGNSSGFGSGRSGGFGDFGGSDRSSGFGDFSSPVVLVDLVIFAQLDPVVAWVIPVLVGSVALAMTRVMRTLGGNHSNFVERLVYADLPLLVIEHAFVFVIV
ncbi:putative mitochondrial RNA helicase 2 [Actinidia rufa]|uniref:Putative mitochondrial RNA helicase 2 n=1 Tax=Actinidia rufa TaxID=165716 RepID=A0A7J0G9Z6_9ERIC|nr:putative mitochondrial RNA helicase 2 [Actinidia rufa]